MVESKWSSEAWKRKRALDVHKEEIKEKMKPISLIAQPVCLSVEGSPVISEQVCVLNLSGEESCLSLRHRGR